MHVAVTTAVTVAMTNMVVVTMPYAYMMYELSLDMSGPDISLLTTGDVAFCCGGTHLCRMESGYEVCNRCGLLNAELSRVMR